MKSLLSGLFTLLFILSSSAQYPAYFSYNTENGAPSNEMYWTFQDKDGYIWIGCDAGIYRFNGVRYEHFSSPDLTARSATGIIQSKSTGRIYAYNFNKQLFYIENEKLYVIKGWDKPINGLADDTNGNIWITSSEGAFKLNERDNKITIVTSPHHYFGSGDQNYTSHGISDPDGNVYYQNGARVFIWKNNTEQIIQLDDLFMGSALMLSRFSCNPWILSLTGDKILRKTNGAYKDYRNESLLSILKGKKINCVFESKDDKLWIGTFTGLICHDPISKKTELFHENLSFSFGIEDKEGNYWFSTLHNGLLRIPNLKVISWGTKDKNGSNEQFTHISGDEQFMYIGGTNGFINVLNKKTYELNKFEHLPLSDLGMLYADPLDKCVYFNKINNIFRFKNGKFELINSYARPVKTMLHTRSGYFFLSSQGLFFTKRIDTPLGENNNMIELAWHRDICRSPFSNGYYTASNNGLNELVPHKDTYRIRKKYLEGKQVISLTEDPENKLIYLYSFDGTLYSLNAQRKLKKIVQLDNDVRVSQIRFNSKRLFLATNKGILIIDPQTKKQFLFDRFSGLSSNNTRGISFQGNMCFVVGESIQQIPISLFREASVKAIIKPRQVLLNGKAIEVGDLIEMNYDDKLSLDADGLSYRSNGNFQFAYQIKGLNSNWIKVPGSVEKIDFASLPSGYITIELKLIDHEGMDSANILSYKLYVSPPFWQRWWFYVLIILMVAGSAFLIFRSRLIKLRKKQQQALKELRLENELRLTQQNALKAQMNPHFLFNVLNSIKGYIYENDKKNAARYLSDFSSLVRKVLELSSVPTVSMEQEIEALKLYIDLEAMLLQSDFDYTIQIDDNVDLSGIQVPALLLQPYVENAFKHGLRHKSGQKRLIVQIQMNEQDGLLIINITDNGIGRVAAAELNSQNRGEHQSFATSAMEKRLQLLNFEKKDVVGVEIRDNFEKEQPSGTTVIIRIHV